jgi:1,2-phenylacetyl-CoA epoxidase PaaB subunit
VTRWSVDIIGKQLQHLGTVLAENERKALEEAIKQFAIRPALRSKIAVTKVPITTNGMWQIASLAVSCHRVAPAPAA